MNAFSKHVFDSSNVKDEIRRTLKGPVLKTMRKLLPTLHHIPEQFTYDHVMGSIHLLELCLTTFRIQPDQFHDVLRDRHGTPVADHTTQLRCGRTLGDVVSMVVRTSARRYFNSKLSTESGNQKSEADTLYDSIKEYLLFDWQVPLVPSYARMTPLQVKRLGVDLLELNTKSKLARAIGLTPPPKREKAKLRSLADVIAAGSVPKTYKHRDKDQPEQTAIGQADTPIAKLTAQPKDTTLLGSIDPRAVSLLANGLGLDRPQLVVFIQGVHINLGNDRFLRVFAHGADPRLLERMIDHAKHSKIGPKSTPTDIAAYVNRAFTKQAATA